jgi:hypothetical protein
VAFTTGEVARQVVANLGLDSGYELATQWIGQRYAELCSRAKFRHLRKYGQLYLPAPVQTGTCTITQDSTTVLLDSSGIAACQAQTFFQWPDGFSGLWFRPQIGTAWSRISSVTAAGAITLETPFASDNGFMFSNPPVQAGITFYILPRYVELDPTARQIGTMVCDFMYRPLEIISEDQLNLKAPNRFLVSAYPQYAAELNSNANTTGYPKQIEIYPWPVQSVTLHYTFWQTPPVLGFGDFIPPTIDIDILRTGAMIDMANNQMGKAIRMGDLNKAGFFRNVANQESTNFEKKVNRAIRNDRGAEDLAFVLRRRGWMPPTDWDPIKGAFENFLARGV